MSAGYAGVRVLVLGASGFIGRWVARSLAHMGAEVTCGVRDASAMLAAGAAYGFTSRVLPVDVFDEASVDSLLDACRPAITFNLAGYGVDRSERDEARSWRINAELVRQLGDLVHRYPAGDWTGQRLVHTGSALEYGPIGGHLPEDATPSPTTLYGMSKLAGTRALLESWPSSTVTARLFTVYGAGEHDGRLLPTLLQAQGHTEAVPLSEGSQRRDFTYVEDVADGLLRLGRQPIVIGGVVNLATGRSCSVRDFAETAASVLGIPQSRLDFGALPWRPDEMPHDEVAVTRLREILDWTPGTPVAEGIRRTVRFGAETPG
jgi:nucleoside-diphosphate-sugar epimerase